MFEILLSSEPDCRHPVAGGWLRQSPGFVQRPDPGQPPPHRAGPPQPPFLHGVGPPQPPFLHHDGPPFLHRAPPLLWRQLGRVPLFQCCSQYITLIR